LLLLGVILACAVGLLPAGAGGGNRQPPTNITRLPDYEVAPNVVADPEGNLHLVYQGGPSGRWHARYMFKPAGGNWSAFTDLGGVNIARPRIAWSPTDGSLHVVWHDQNEIYYRRGESSDGPWGPIQRVSAADGRRSLEAAVACDTWGTVHVVWHDEAAGPSSWDIHYRRFEAGEWQPIERISPSPDQDVFPAIAVGLDDQVHVVWCNYQGTRAVFHRLRTADGTWSGVSRLDNTNARSLNPHVAVLGWSDIVLVVWHDDTPGNWDIAFSFRAGDTWYGPTYLAHPGVTDAFPQIACNQNDFTFAIVWTDYNNLFIQQYTGGADFDPRQTIIPNYGCKESTIAVDPVTGMIHAIAQARRNGVTVNNSWDLIWACE
jgi:hypothetical protein